MNSKITALLIIPCLLLCSIASAQDATAVTEMQKIRAYYSGPELKHVKGQMLLLNKATGQQKDKVDFEYWIKDEQVFTKMNYIEILSNKDVYVMVNNNKKTIYVRRTNDLSFRSQGTIFDADQLNKLLNTKGTKTTLEKSGGINKLTLSGLYDSRFSEINISYEAATNKIKSVYAILKQMPDEPQMILKISYSETEKTTVKTMPDILLAERYGKMENSGDFRYAKNYQGYKKL